MRCSQLGSIKDRGRIENLKAGLGLAIKRQRCGVGLSQAALARRAGLHRTYVSDLERGSRNPSIESIDKLARALHVSVLKLFEAAAAEQR